MAWGLFSGGSKSTYEFEVQRRVTQSNIYWFIFLLFAINATLFLSLAAKAVQEEIERTRINEMITLQNLEELDDIGR